MEMTHKKPSPTTGKVAAEPSEGASVSRHKRMKIVWVKSENIEMAHTKKPSPHTGKVSALADERGKYEQKRKNENSVGKIRKYRNGSYKKAVPACRGKCQQS